MHCITESGHIMMQKSESLNQVRVCFRIFYSIKALCSAPFFPLNNSMFQFIAKEELEKNERTQMKQLTLEISERQEEEELQVKEHP